MSETRQEANLELLRRMEYQEEIDRVTAVQHVQTEHFRQHTKLEGYYENMDVGGMFSCDRLMKMENMFSRIQFGYNPNRGRSFIFANVKTSRYDTVSSSQQRAMKEYQLNSRKNGLLRAHTSRQKNETSVLFEHKKGKPWSENVIRRYYGNVNEEALGKTLPFLNRLKHRQRLEELKTSVKELQTQIQQNINEGRFEDNILLRQQQTQKQMEENFLSHLILCKESAARNFMNKLNHAYDMQKHEMFEYYQNRAKEEQQLPEAVSAPGEIDHDEEQ